MKKIILMLMVFNIFCFAQTLTQTDKASVTWTAFKTLAKVGVSGDFTSIAYRPASKQSKDLSSLMIGSKIVIDSTKIDTKNPARDATISEMFFKQLPSAIITGKIVSLDEAKSTVTIELQMGGTTKIIPMKYELSNHTFKANGVIDILDFNGANALASISKSCYDLHEGKTWNDVGIQFQTTIISK